MHRHGSPGDRGGADAWYGRPAVPHYYTGASYMSDRVNQDAMTPAEVAEYLDAYQAETGRKDWLADYCREGCSCAECERLEVI